MTHPTLTFEMQTFLQAFDSLILQDESERVGSNEDLSMIDPVVILLELERRENVEYVHQPQGLGEWATDGIKNSEVMKGYDWEGEERRRIEAITKRMREVALKLCSIPNKLICDELNIRRRTPMKRPTPGTEEFETEDLSREWERRKLSKSALKIDPSLLAQMFHEEYERLALHLGYQTREDSRVPWEDVPETNRSLMVATCRSVLSRIAGEGPLSREDLTNSPQVT